MSKEEYSLLPDEITLREIRYVIQEPGRKQQPFVIVTTMLDAKGDNAITTDEIAELFAE